MSALVQHIDYIEQQLESLYLFHRVHSARDFLLKAPNTHLQGEILVVQDRECLDIGIAFHSDIVTAIEDHPPLTSLHSNNLNAWTVLVEEISHFHLILNRAASDREVSRIELEWQAEIDKVLLSGKLLQNQSGDSHVEALLRLIFDAATLNAEEHLSIYTEATRLAAQFWYQSLRQSASPGALVSSDILLRKLRETYHSEWSEKRSLSLNALRKSA